MHTREQLKMLRTAIPFIRAYKGQTFVVKLGGRLCEPGKVLQHLIEQVALLHQLGIRVVLVHGGGDQTTLLSKRLGLEPRIVAGRRITDDQTLDVAKMTMAGLVNTNLLAACRAAQLPAIGMSGVTAGLVAARRRPVQRLDDPESGESRMVDFGWVGDIQSIDATVIETQLAAGYVPIISSLSADAAGQVYNVNADTVAAQIAIALKAAKYILLTTVDGVMLDIGDSTTLQSYLDVPSLNELIKSGAIAGGMLPKLAACVTALQGGVSRVHILNGLLSDTLLCEVLTNEGCGTLVVERREPVQQPATLPASNATIANEVSVA